MEFVDDCMWQGGGGVGRDIRLGAKATTTKASVDSLQDSHHSSTSSFRCKTDTRVATTTWQTQTRT